MPTRENNSHNSSLFLENLCQAQVGGTLLLQTPCRGSMCFSSAGMTRRPHDVFGILLVNS